MDLGLAGKVAIVTAATANIGRGIALELAAEGAKVVIVGRDAEAGARTVEACQARGAGDAVFVAADLLDKAAPQRIPRCCGSARPRRGSGEQCRRQCRSGLLRRFRSDKWAGDIDLNFGTVLRMTHAVLPGMIERKRGAIVNVGSTAGLVGDYMLPVYSAAKGAVHSFTVVLAKEVGKHGIRVNAIAPYATFATDPAAFSKGSRFNPESGLFAKGMASVSEEDRAIRQRRTFVGRPFATPEEMSSVVALLASDRASFVTGQVWPVDGGSLM